MTRADVPTLVCDRCGFTTQDLHVMGKFNKLTHYHMSGSNDWDLCTDCWAAFVEFLDSKR